MQYYRRLEHPTNPIRQIVVRTSYFLSEVNRCFQDTHHFNWWSALLLAKVGHNDVVVQVWHGDVHVVARAAKLGNLALAVKGAQTNPVLKAMRT